MKNDRRLDSRILETAIKLINQEEVDSNLVYLECVSQPMGRMVEFDKDFLCIYIANKTNIDLDLEERRVILSNGHRPTFEKFLAFTMDNTRRFIYGLNYTIWR